MQEFSLFIVGIWSILNKKLHFCRYFSFGLEWGACVITELL